MPRKYSFIENLSRENLSHGPSRQALIFELKWLSEMDTKKRLEGDYTWLKMVYKF